jgi:hypothetical protein
MVAISAGILKVALAANNFMLWASSAIVVGIVSHFIDKYADGQHLKYEEVIVSFMTMTFAMMFSLTYHSHA